MRNTIAKAKILELINHSEVALSHSEIEKLVDGLCNRVTIYRVLDRLTEEGHIHKFVNIDGHLKFAACHHCDAHHHHDHAHFSCTQCGTVSCLESVEPVYKLPKEYKVQEMNFVLSGICPRCVK
ncbi:transcriptional repressor [Elizabethkingia meningoseptica]|uniref:Fur family transcriptional regulator n=1 Tax=Elizabethkingia meningoseptica TaxID=238 RepID=A0A1V3U2I4_ELIME|nr:MULTISPECIES: transcriptional repressor [Elizabethkingia]AQX06220.1 Fur family transcriptional regulator [Elizabethkingia meningoseptica]AQX13751.1 Fur family transcriptional regulator [Elizabethkingia meningoseptica]AQX48267.1 Fur family transcriptional regulator [Elizabethkingia meningoseptica]EJK5327346.1 transcriptional repressor [Elizabethkingia meningoseptica]EOR29372.1 ferric uptake regulator family protein [Elizabethkingia meningoseptica ATCC 13253 = NBRC 12535]